MNKASLTFTHQGKQYSGTLEKVQGSGSTASFHLMVDGYYLGRLRYTTQWVFDSTPKLDLSQLAEEFGYVVTAWYQ